MLVLSRRIIALRETFPPPSPPFRPYPSRTVSSSDRPFYPSGNSTRLQLFRAMARQQGASGTAESSGWRQVCIFTRRPPPPPPHSGVYNGGGAFHAACSCSRFVHRVSFVHPCNSCNDNLYEKCFPPFPRHRRCFPPPPPRENRPAREKCRPSNYRPRNLARTSWLGKNSLDASESGDEMGERIPS